VLELPSSVATEGKSAVDDNLGTTSDLTAFPLTPLEFTLPLLLPLLEELWGSEPTTTVPLWATRAACREEAALKAPGCWRRVARAAEGLTLANAIILRPKAARSRRYAWTCTARPREGSDRRAELQRDVQAAGSRRWAQWTEAVSEGGQIWKPVSKTLYQGPSYKCKGINELSESLRFVGV